MAIEAVPHSYNICCLNDVKASLKWWYLVAGGWAGVTDCRLELEC